MDGLTYKLLPKILFPPTFTEWYSGYFFSIHKTSIEFEFWSLKVSFFFLGRVKSSGENEYVSRFKPETLILSAGENRGEKRTPESRSENP